MINDWLRIPYRAHGRDDDGCDCWGLVRIVRKALRGDALPSYGSIVPDDKRAITGAAGEFIDSGFRPCVPRPGAIATVWRGQLCLHVGVVIEAEGRLAVMETNRGTGARWMRVADFAAKYPKVIYIDNN